MSNRVREVDTFLLGSGFREKSFRQFLRGMLNNCRFDTVPTQQGQTLYLEFVLLASPNTINPGTDISAFGPIHQNGVLQVESVSIG